MEMKTSLDGSKLSEPSKYTMPEKPLAVPVAPQPVPPAPKPMDSYCVPGFVDSNKPNLPAEFSQDCINGERPDWNTFDGMSVVRDNPLRRLILRFKNYRITISGYRLNPVIQAIDTKQLKSIAPSTPASIHDLRNPFIESVDIEFINRSEE